MCRVWVPLVEEYAPEAPASTWTDQTAASIALNGQGITHGTALKVSIRGGHDTLLLVSEDGRSSMVQWYENDGMEMVVYGTHLELWGDSIVLEMGSSTVLPPRGPTGARFLEMSRAQRRADRRHSAKVSGILALVVLLVVSVGAWWFYFRAPPPLAVTRGEIAKIELIAIPEGPGLAFARNPNKIRGEVPLSGALPKVPIPLPAPLRQGFWCHMGGLVRFTLTDGRIITYGPCRLPPEIQSFRASLFG